MSIWTLHIVIDQSSDGQNLFLNRCRLDKRRDELRVHYNSSHKSGHVTLILFMNMLCCHVVRSLKVTSLEVSTSPARRSCHVVGL